MVWWQVLWHVCEPTSLSRRTVVSQAVIDSEALPTALRTAAADAADFGLSILYPTPKERKQLLTALISKVRHGWCFCCVGVA